ncbi:MAG: hypothetical protein WCB85_10525 [Candidatus Dormiibacterota bacterium]
MSDRGRVGLAWGLAGLTLALAPASLVLLPMVWTRLTSGAGGTNLRDRLDAAGGRRDITGQPTQDWATPRSEPVMVRAAALAERR